MASQQTPNYKLSRWAGTDRVLVEEFNDNWDKIDAELKERSCRFYTTTYVGTGENPFTLTFPHKPMVYFIFQHSNSTFAIGIQGAPRSMGHYLTSTDTVHTTWEGNSVTLDTHGGSVVAAGNAKGSTYTLVALLDAND